MGVKNSDSLLHVLSFVRGGMIMNSCISIGQSHSWRSNSLHIDVCSGLVCSKIILGLLAAFLFALPAGADITVDSIDKSTEIWFPGDGQIFRVPNKYATIDITTLAETTISYNARASLDLWPYTGESLGGTLFHSLELNFDGEKLLVWRYEDVDDAPLGEYEGEWMPHSVSVGPEELRLTKTCAVGTHYVILTHSVFDEKTLIHAFDYDWIDFEVVPAPVPGAFLLAFTGLGSVSFLRRRLKVQG